MRRGLREDKGSASKSGRMARSASGTASKSCGRPRSRGIRACGREKSLRTNVSRSHDGLHQGEAAPACRRRDREAVHNPEGRPSATRRNTSANRTERIAGDSTLNHRKGKSGTFLLWRKPDICTLGRHAVGPHRAPEIECEDEQRHQEGAGKETCGGLMATSGQTPDGSSGMGKVPSNVAR